MPTTFKINLVSRLLIICLTLCGLSSGQIYNEDERCDFGKYKGTCLRASKCLELPVIAEEMGLKSADVGHCGFTAVEEIICCPFRKTPALTANALPNKFIDLLRPFEFRSPPEDDSTTRSIQMLPAGWLSNNFRETNINNTARSNNANAAPGGWPNNETAQRLNAIFNTTSVRSGNTIVDNSQKINAIFNGNSLPNGEIINNNAQRVNTIFSGDDTQKLNAIFNGKAVASGNTIEDDAQRIGSIFNGNSVRNENVINANVHKVNTIFNRNDLNEENTQRLNAIFNAEERHIRNPINASTERINNILKGNPIPIGDNTPSINAKFSGSSNPVGSINDDEARRINDIFNGNLVPSGKTIVDSTSVIFNGNSAQNGNTINENTANAIFKANNQNEKTTQRLNTIFDTKESQMSGANAQRINDIFKFSAVPIQNSVLDNIKGISGVSDGGSLREDRVNEKLNAIFNRNPSSENTQRIYEIFNGNHAAKINQVQDNTEILGGNANRQNNIQTTNAIFDRKAVSSAHLNGNSFQAGSANIDHTQRLNAIFNTDKFAENTQSNNSQGGNTPRMSSILNDNSMQLGRQNDPFQNYLKQPRTRGQIKHRSHENDEIFNIPVQQPPLPLRNQFQR